MDYTLKKSIIYHISVIRIKSKINKKPFYPIIRNIQCFFYLIFLIVKNFLTRKKEVGYSHSSLGILTSPSKHVKYSINKVENNVLFLGKYSLLKNFNIKLSSKDIKNIFYIGKKFSYPSFELILIFIEYNLFLNFFNKINIKDLYVSNSMDRYIIFFSSFSKKFNFTLSFIPHGIIMNFPIKYKVPIDFVYLDRIDNKLQFEKYFNFSKCIEVLDLINPFIIGAPFQIAYASSPNMQLANIKFVLQLWFKFRSRVLVYCHPRENKIFFTILDKIKIVKLTDKRYCDTKILFGRYSTLSLDMYNYNISVVFVNLENRSNFDYPISSRVIPNNITLNEIN